MERINHLKTAFRSIPENEKLARMLAASFMALADPTIEEMEEVKTAVSEAVTNAIIHGYGGSGGHEVGMECELLEGAMVRFTITDSGRGIADVAQAMEPFYTTCPEQERSGMGFAVMAGFTDRLEVISHPGEGTRVVLEKRLLAPCTEQAAKYYRNTAI